jgi:hypothetical protein
MHDVVGGALDRGLNPERAIALYRHIRYFTVGEILVRSRAARRVGDERPRYRDTVFAKLNPSRFPSLAAVGKAGRSSRRGTLTRGG